MLLSDNKERQCEPGQADIWGPLYSQRDDRLALLQRVCARACVCVFTLPRLKDKSSVAAAKVTQPFFSSPSSPPCNTVGLIVLILGFSLTPRSGARARTLSRRQSRKNKTSQPLCCQEFLKEKQQILPFASVSAQGHKLQLFRGGRDRGSVCAFFHCLPALLASQCLFEGACVIHTPRTS